MIGYHISINYTPASKILFEDFYLLKCDPNNIKWTGWSKTPNKSKLLSWYNAQLSNPKRDIFMFYDSKDIVGYLYLDKLGDSADLGYGVISSHSGKGIGSFIIQIAIIKAIQYNFKEITAWVSENNIPSIKILEKNGFHKTSNFQFRKLPKVVDSDKFYLWSMFL